MNSLKSSINHIIKIFILLIFLSPALFAQLDTLKVEETPDTAKFVMQKSPWGAVLRSAILPGFGQFYNESYWKIPVVWGIMGWLAYNWNDNNNLYQDYKDLYIQTGNENFKRIRDFYRDQRDLFTIYLALTYLLNMVDAYVDAQLFDFSVQENIQTGQPMLNLRVKF